MSHAASGVPRVSPIRRRRTVVSDICERLTGYIVRGEWSAGMRIPAERELCQLLEAGRSSVREALKALEIMGLVESRLGDGTFVCDRSRFLSAPLLMAIASHTDVEVRELTEARRLIESELAAFAAQRATAEDLKAIGKRLDEMAGSGGDAELSLNADLAFHIAIAEAAHNRILMNALELIRNLTRQWIRDALRMPNVHQEALAQHTEIFLAIAKKQPEEARAKMSAHLEAMSSKLEMTRVQADTSPDAV